MAERVQSIWLLLASLLVLAGGAALMLRLEAALWFFLVSCFGQALYIGLIAPRFFDPGNPPDLAGRRQTTNAFLIYVAATVVVVWAFSAGLLVSWRAVPWFVLAAACLATAAYSAYAIWQLIQSLRGTARGDDA